MSVRDPRKPALIVTLARDGSRRGRKRKLSPKLRRVQSPLIREKLLEGLLSVESPNDSSDSNDSNVSSIRSAIDASDVEELASLSESQDSQDTQTPSAVAPGQKSAAPSVFSTGAAVGRKGRPSNGSVSQKSAPVKGPKTPKSQRLSYWMEGSLVTSSERPKIPGEVELTDLSNAFRLATEYGQDIRYCEKWGKWVAWNGRRWVAGQSSAATRAAAKFAFDRFLEASAYSLPAPDDPSFPAERDKKKELLSATRALAGSQRINAMINLAKHTSAVAVSPDDFDKDSMKFNATNGTIDLRTGEIYDHRRSDYLAKIAGRGSDDERICGAYYPVQTDDDCPRWIKFINTVTCGDKDLADYLQRIVGYCMTGNVSERALFIFFGLGSNGKGTFLRVLQDVMGDYAQPAPQGMLEENHSDDHPSRIASLHGARLAICAEVEKGRKLAEGLVKDLTGADRLAARRMREDFWYFYPTHKLILQGNYKPIISGTDFGIWSRVHIIPWNAKFQDNDESQVRDYADKLLPEASAILGWCVRGCLMWQERGLRPPVSVVAETKKFMREMDHLREYAQERLYRSFGSVVARDDLRDDYEAWATERELPLVGIYEFVPQMRKILQEQFGAVDTKARVEDHGKYSVRVFKHVNFRSGQEAPIVPSKDGRNYDS